jgi:hypothetical protein
MPKLLLKFGINLEESGSRSAFLEHHGPQFHRWLPDGERDAIFLDTGDPNAILKVWFERRGFVDGSFIKYDRTRREVDPGIVPKQAVLDAGPLIGLLEINAISEEELVPLRDNKVGDDVYKDLGKKAIKLIYPPINNFLNIIRTNYGQYWIPELEAWDSRQRPVGNYCRFILNMKWSLDEGGTWTDFIADNEPSAGIVGVVNIDKSFREFISKEDWGGLANVIREGYKPSGAAFILARAHQLHDEGNLKYAFIEGVSALELALGDFVRSNLHTDARLSEDMKSFWNLPLRSQLIAIAIGRKEIPLEKLKDSLEAIEIRNKVIHEGLNPLENASTKLSKLLEGIAGLLSGPRFRFPEGNPGNALRPVETWEQQAR